VRRRHITAAKLALLPPPCRRQAAANVRFCAAADVRFRAAADFRFCAAGTAAAAALLPPRCRRRRTVAKLPPTSLCRATATATATAAAAAAAAATAPQFVGWLLRCRCILKVI
jgi:hypothetical protein